MKRSLSKLLEQARGYRMSAEGREEQRQSLVRAMTTPCEHGMLDFEQCPECRGWIGANK